MHHIFVFDENSLYSFLANEIAKQQTRLSSGGKITGPIYICISQAPYLKYNNAQSGITDKYLDARIDILNNKNPYYFENINSEGSQDIKTNTVESDTISSLYCHILIIYPAYNPATGLGGSSGKITLKDGYDNKATFDAGITTFLNTTMASFYTDNELCFIKCNKSSTLNCGCLTRNTNATTSPTTKLNTDTSKTDAAIDTPLYPSKCIDHHISGGITAGNFSMMYYVNPFSDNYTNKIVEPE
jgi:hypothetical protein